MDGEGNTNGVAVVTNDKTNQSEEVKDADTSSYSSSGSNNSSIDDKSEVATNGETRGSTAGVTENGPSTDSSPNCTETSTANPHFQLGGEEEEEEAEVNGDSGKMNGGEDDKKQADSEDTRRPSELELLRQLEEANRMLEADAKSHPVRAAFSTTPGHSRKGSGSSIVSSTSTNSFYSQQNSNEGGEDAELRPTEGPTAKPVRPPKKSFKPLLRIRSSNNNKRKGSTSSDNTPLSPTQIKSFQSAGRRFSTPADQTDGVPIDSVPAGACSETLWEIWGRIINDWDSVKKRPAFLRELVRKGIPHEFRGMAWQLILGVHDSIWKQEYAEHMKKTSPCEKLIRRDIARTFPDHDFFKEKDGFGQESLFNVMKAYSLHDREVGYCQGSGFIVGLLLMQMPEEDAFAVLVRLMQDFRLRELFKPSMAELGLCMFKLECLIQELLPTLLVHFQTQNFDTSMYASSWFLTLYVTSLPLSLARRIMDLFVSEGMEMIFRVGVAILQSCQEDLLALDMEGLLKYLQKDLRSRFEQETDQENLLHTAYNIKYSHKKMKKLEKEYTALKTKENEDQIELRRLRTENRLLRQRIENLEKVEAKLLRQNEESATLADKLVQDQVTWAQEVEQCYALKNELSVTRQQLQDTQKKLFDAEDIIGDIRKRTRIIEETVHLDESEERNMVKHLQEELIAVRLREAETAGTIKELKQKISELEDTNLRLQRAPSNDVQQLQEELIAVKLREAEANLSLKELRMKVNEIEGYWEAHMERVRQNSPKEKNSKAELRHLQEEVMALKLKEARAVSDLKDAKQKLMELETQNQICTNQIRRMGDDNKELKRLLEEAAEREKDLKTNIKDLTHKLDDTETKRKEEAMMARIRDAENIQQLAELRQKIAEIDIQKEEILAAGQLHDKGENQELENKLHDLQDEVLQLHLSMSGNKQNLSGQSLMTESYLGNNSDEELDAEIRDSENLDQTLLDIIEGRSGTSSRNSLREDNFPGCGNSLSLSNIGNADSSSLDEMDSMRACVNSESDDRLSSHEKSSKVGSEVGGAVGGVDDGGGDGSRGIEVAARAANGSLLATATTLPGGDGAKDSSDLPTYSGESNVIADCDLPPREVTGAEGNDSQGKNAAAVTAVSHKSTNQQPCSGASKPLRVDSVVASQCDTEKTEGCGNSENVYRPDVTAPDQRFPPDWELYEEVVEIDKNQEARVICRNSADRDSSGVRNSMERSCSVSSNGSNSNSRKGSVERGWGPSLSKTTPKTGVWSRGSIGNTENVGSGATSDVKRKKSVESRTQNVSDSAVGDDIPDVVVIYEPSRATGSWACSYDENDDADFVLKESTV